MFCSGDDASGHAVTVGLSAAESEYLAGARRRFDRRWLRATLAVPAAVGLLIAIPGPAQASIGVGVQGAPVRLRTIARPGSSYALPPVYVVNTGTQDESISMRIQRLSHGPGRTVPPSWIQFTGDGMQLSAGKSARVPLELVVPAGAAPGKYLSDVVVVGSAAISVGKANLGVAAATKLEFSVGQGSGSGLGFPPWTLWTMGGLLLAAAAMLAFRVSGLQVRVVRRPVSSSFIDSQGE
jgi:hypothetical protein